MPKASSTVPVAERLTRLRKALADPAAGQERLDAFIVPTDDAHMSENPPFRFQRRAFLTNFSGSAGTAVVCGTKAALWTDGRYFLQAAAELSSEWDLMRMGTKDCPEIAEWLGRELAPGGRVGFDPSVHTISATEALESGLKQRGLSLVPRAANPVDAIWTDAPQLPSGPARAHPSRWAGRTAAEKLAAVRAEMATKGAGALVCAGLSETCWLLNLRASDSPSSPLLLAYTVVEPARAELFVHAGRLSADLAGGLEQAGVQVRAYDDAAAGVEAAAERAAGAGAKVWLDPELCSAALGEAALRGVRRGRAAQAPAAKKTKVEGAGSGAEDAPSGILRLPNPVSAAKVVKNAAELEGMREAHLRDGVALCSFLAKLDALTAAGGELSEVEVDEQLTAERAKQEGFLMPSFPTIAGEGPNGAVIHYRAEAATARTVKKGSLLLLDSGGQYDCGTTDVTRTVSLHGDPTAFQREAFTRVLQGHAQMDMLVWPAGTTGQALDTLARATLWKAGLDYRHGTGHGVGAALEVHESPPGISARKTAAHALQLGMIVSNEPGYYHDGEFGVRCENLFEVVAADTPHAFGDAAYFTCRAITLAPWDRRLLDLDALTREERAWVDGYHARVRDELEPRLRDRPDVLEWLSEQTKPL